MPHPALDIAESLWWTAQDANLLVEPAGQQLGREVGDRQELGS